jgi:pyrroline-5-carboxylate reductase
MRTIGFIGGGNMAEALIKGIIAAKIYPPKNIFVSDIRQERLTHLEKEYKVKTIGDNAELASKTDVLVLAVKPQNMAEALESIKGAFKKTTLVVSIAGGKNTAGIAAVLGDVAIVRVMPNTPALIGEGASALFANDEAKPRLAEAEKIFSAVGRAVIVDNEDLIDAVTAISGSGPAYYFLMMEEMIKAAIKLGLPENVAKNLVIQTAKGAALLAAEADERGEKPAELRRKVTSPGGTTEAAIRVFEQKGFGELIAAATHSACVRSKELSRQ